jgi:hypothetical protein
VAFAAPVMTFALIAAPAEGVAGELVKVMVWFFESVMHTLFLR